MKNKRYASDVEEAEMVDKQEETGWKKIHGDVFRYPKHKSLFSAALGSGSQLLLLLVFLKITFFYEHRKIIL